MPRKVIIGYDGSEHGEDALVLGGLFAEVLGASPLVAAALPHPGRGLDGEAVEATLRERSEPLFATARERLAGLEVETRAVPGDSPAGALHELAQAQEPILVVVGSTHCGPLGRVFIGSVGEALLSGAPCAVAVAPRDYAKHESHRLLRLGVGVSGSEESWPALNAGIALAERLHAAFTVIAVARPPHYGYDASLAALTAGEYRSVEQQEMDRVLDQATERIPARLPMRRLLLEGDPAGAIAEAAEDLDLLIVGSRGYGPLRGTLLGGVSAKLMRSSPCPVLVLPRGAASNLFGSREPASARATAGPEA